MDDAAFREQLTYALSLAGKHMDVTVYRYALDTPEQYYARAWEALVVHGFPESALRLRTAYHLQPHVTLENVVRMGHQAGVMSIDSMGKE